MSSQRRQYWNEILNAHPQNYRGDFHYYGLVSGRQYPLSSCGLEVRRYALIIISRFYRKRGYTMQPLGHHPLTPPPAAEEPPTAPPKFGL